MNRHLAIMIVLLPAGWLDASARADVCSQLAGDKRALAEKLQRGIYPYDCCDEPLDRCLKQKRVCRLARRLRDDVCRRVAAGQDERRIKTALERRARSMIAADKRASIDLSTSPPAGENRRVTTPPCIL